MRRNPKLDRPAATVAKLTLCCSGSGVSEQQIKIFIPENVADYYFSEFISVETCGERSISRPHIRIHLMIL